MNGFRIISTKHFSERLGERKIDLSLIAQIYAEIAKNPFANIYKLSNDYSSIVFAVDRDKGEVKLITCYSAN